MNATSEEIHQLNEQAWSDRATDIQKSLKLAEQVQAMIANSPESETRE